MEESYSNEIAEHLLHRASQRQESYRVNETQLIEMAHEAGIEQTTLEEIKREWRMEIRLHHERKRVKKLAIKSMKWLVPIYLLWTIIAVNASHDRSWITIALVSWFVSTLWMGNKALKILLLEKVIRKGDMIYPALSPTEAAQIEATPLQISSLHLY